MKITFLFVLAGLILPLLGVEPEGERWSKKALQQDLEPFQVEVYQQLSRIHKCQLQQIDHRGSISILSFTKDKGSQTPLDILHSMGMKVLPILSEGLDDDTPSLTVTSSRWTEERVWKVNDLVARLICRITDREFVIGEWGGGFSLRNVGKHPELQAQFKERIMNWYDKNKSRTIEERKIADLQSNLRNRLDAIKWLGRHKSRLAAHNIVERIETILGGKEVSSSTQAELGEASIALGMIGDTAARPFVKEVCEHLSYWIYMKYRPIEQGRSGGGSQQIANLFRAYHGMALLDNKKQAIADLEGIWGKYNNEMEAYTRKEYEALLQKAKDW